MTKIMANPTTADTAFLAYHPEIAMNPDGTSKQLRRMIDCAAYLSGEQLAVLLSGAKPNIGAKLADKLVKMAIRNHGVAGILAPETIDAAALANGRAIVARLWPGSAGGPVRFPLVGFLVSRAFLENSLGLAGDARPTTVSGLAELLHADAVKYGRSLALRTDITAVSGFAIDPLMYAGETPPANIDAPTVETKTATPTVETPTVETPISGETRSFKQLAAALKTAGVEFGRRASKIELAALAAKHGV